MYLKKINLTNFRNYKNENIEFINGINLFVGNNAQGKTNIIEAIYLSAFAKSYRTIKDVEMIMFNKDYLKVDLEYIKKDISIIQNTYIDKLNKKQIKIDEVKIKKSSDVIGNIPLVIFSPDDLDIIKGSGASRRKFIDMICCQLSKSYLITFSEYNKVLKTKNNLLKKDLTKEDKEYILILNEKLAEYIIKIIPFRKKIILKLLNYSKSIIKKITDDKENIDIDYITEFDNKNKDEVIHTLNKVLEYEILRKTSLKGISKDVINININNNDVNKYGSQGQKRTVLLILKLASFEIIKEIISDSPILLLDDIMSELDSYRIQFLLDYIKNYQVIITTTEFKEKINNKNIKIKKILNGTCNDMQ